MTNMRKVFCRTTLAAFLAAACHVGAPAISSAQAAPDRSGASANVANNIADLSDAELEAKIGRFIEGFYLSGQDLTRSEIRTLYAPRVDYFGGKQKSRRAIVRDKMAYFNRWPDRSYELIPGTLTVLRAGPAGNLVTATFEYRFDTRGGGRRSTGRGFSVLTLDFTEPNGQIVREQGKVISRR